MKTSIMTRIMTRAGSCLLLIAIISVCFLSLTLLSGCRSKAPAHATELAGDAKSYHLKGVIVATDAAKGEIQVNSEAIPGFMDAMIMPYKLKDPGIIQDLHAGDHLTATLLVLDSSAILDQIVITAQAKPDYKPSANYHVPAVGDEVPDFTFLNQDAKQISLRSFRGKALLITFIYTRCPLPDYCPRMVRNFAAIDKQLKATPDLYAKTHLLSISFEPAYELAGGPA